MDECDRITIAVREDVAAIKEKIIASDKMQQERSDTMSGRISKIESSLERIDTKLDRINDEVTRLQSQNKTLKWVIGTIVSIVAVAAAWLAVR